MTVHRTSSITRLLLAAVVITFGAYWAGARWGQRQPVGVAALQPGGGATKDISAANVAARDAALTDEEAINVRVYRQVSPAVANPFGFQSTLTTGVVSAIGRTVQTSQTTFIDEAIQTDAAINRGNSGGPLINSRGEVIGINSAIFTPSGTTAGIGFAIPINSAKRIAHDLMTEGRVHTAFLGVQTMSVGGQLAEALDLPAQEGLLVESATKGGPAAAAGIRGGDRVVRAGMQRIAVGWRRTGPDISRDPLPPATTSLP